MREKDQVIAAMQQRHKAELAKVKAALQKAANKPAPRSRQPRRPHELTPGQENKAPRGARASILL